MSLYNTKAYPTPRIYDSEVHHSAVLYVFDSFQQGGPYQLGSNYRESCNRIMPKWHECYCGA